MPPLSDTDTKFIFSILSHSGATTVDWKTVADECGYTNIGSAKNRFAALKKAHTPAAAAPSGSNSKMKTPPGDDAKKTPRSLRKKRKVVDDDADFE